METDYDNQEKKEMQDLYSKKVAKLKSFYEHAFVYGIGLIVFVLKEFFGAPFNFFPIQYLNSTVMGFWTIVFLISAIDVFASYKIFGKDWEERKMKSILERKVKKQKWE